MKKNVGSIDKIVSELLLQLQHFILHIPVK